MIPRPVNQRGLASSEGNIAAPFYYEDLPLERSPGSFLICRSIYLRN